MAKYKISALSIGSLEATIYAKDSDEAMRMLENKLENGELREVDGWIEDLTVTEL